MSVFRIDNTNFGIDRKQSSVALTGLAGDVCATVEVYGSQESYERIAENENSEWSWTLYPPHFYLREFPVQVANSKVATANISVDDLEEYEVAVYLIEHNDVDDLELHIDPNRGLLQVRGRVFLSGEPHSLEIEWSF